MTTDDYYATLEAHDRPIFMQHVSGFAVPSQPGLGSFPDSYAHAVQALARSRGIALDDAAPADQIRHYDTHHTT